MAVDPGKVAFWWPDGLKKFKEKIFSDIAVRIAAKGGRIVKSDFRPLADLPPDVLPIVGCHPPLKDMIDGWRKSGRPFIYWDRGYAVRIFATWLRRPESGSGYYRWSLNAFQLQKLRNVPDDRWKQLRIDVKPWQTKGSHIVVAMPTPAYSALHGTERWTDETVANLNRFTDRRIIIRSKESKVPLWKDLEGAHALVSHGSNAANESIVFGTPVFCDKSCAAALVGQTDISKIESPIYPDRQPWFNSLAYSQFTESEMTDGTLWHLIA